jgi:hypothetical protein
VKTHPRLTLRFPGECAHGVHAQRLADESSGQLDVPPTQLEKTAGSRNTFLQSDRAAVDPFVEVENRGSDVGDIVSEHGPDV